MAVMDLVPLFSLFLSLVVAQMKPMPMCTASYYAPPSCLLTFTPWMAPQIGPTSTIYKAIVTTMFDVCSSPAPLRLPD